ncbi:hypothetical protein I302_107517 [Kwoniella bestiolae CBS 10118]|uniref:Ribosome biogenesis protein SLX9 n=1 Tax=Kwoniella bestiolae CBS 10118 TaxID=1296100 RepID=A0A1B9FYA3_9TREE|nr:hypothetical protein I302_06742 [Kwoniella bestiolae CBS 10118]OCF23758.1 hypothetical protein I302_06742 [Kwoniella bestiolae CBS 10118]
MPRAGHTKSRLHTSAVRLPSKLQTSTEDIAIEQNVAPQSTILNGNHDEPSTSRSKSQKKAEFIAAVQSAPHPYMIKSKSHLRREKRKIKTQNASTNLESLESALEGILPDGENEIQDQEQQDGGAVKGQSKGDKEEERKRKLEKKREERKIGEGRGRTLGEKKRRGVIQESSKRIPAVLSHPAYKANPWATIREHVGNTIATNDKSGSGKK